MATGRPLSWFMAHGMAAGVTDVLPTSDATSLRAWPWLPLRYAQRSPIACTCCRSAALTAGRRVGPGSSAKTCRMLASPSRAAIPALPVPAVPLYESALGVPSAPPANVYEPFWGRPELFLRIAPSRYEPEKLGFESMAVPE